ncbi:diguanylate cyclase domain-containing protein [Pseudoalteromonas sp.]|uniref:sensor domain-containing diguanylate cyclase n=1 Tax=Pseudoalteromonas sp. TaxID=53249 RepID=UPI00356797D1
MPLLKLNVAVTLVYVCTGLFSQLFAIPPGNISPIWVPSGVMFALALRFGSKISYGVFLGAFLGNVWAYFNLNNINAILAALFAATCNGLGDVIAIVVILNLIQRVTQSIQPFDRISHFAVFLLLGVIIGPFLSALFGVTSLTLMNFIPPSDYLYSLVNWWIGDGVGVLLLAPLLHTLFNDRKEQCNPLNLTICTVVSILVSVITFQLIAVNSFFYKLIIALSPAIFAFILLSGRQVVYLVQLAIISVAVYATYQGKGPFYNTQMISPLVDLQCFIAIMSMVIFILALIVEQKRQLINKLSLQKKELELLYRHDKLTRLWNRYGIEEFLHIDILRASRTNHSLALLMIDIDNFKQINDDYGHLAGDSILKEVAKLLSKNVRRGDLVGRWGGEEFIVILTEFKTDKIDAFAKKFVNIINSHNFQLGQPVTISLGYTLFHPGDNIEDLISRADEALYISKANGKNQANAKI